MENIDCCPGKEIKDLSQGIGPERHWYCSRCKAHVYKGQFYPAKEWSDWINEPES